MKSFALVTLAVLTLLLSTATAGAAAPADTSAGRAAALQRQVDAYLAAHPGGKQINETEIAYGGGAFIVAVAPAPGGSGAAGDVVTLASPDCPSGWFCFYDGVNFTYPRGRLSDCGWQDLGWWGWRNRTESAHSNTSGTVYFLGETGDTDTIYFSVSPSRRSIADVSPNRNRADYVYRQCTS